MLSSDSCKTLVKYLLMNCSVKTVQMKNFMLRIFYNIKSGEKTYKNIKNKFKNS